MMELMAEWKIAVQVVGRAHRNADGYLDRGGGSRMISGCLIAPGEFTVPGLVDSPTSEQPQEQATLYAPSGTVVEVGETIVVPAGHPLAGRWQVESPPSPWPLGVVVTINRR